MIDRREWILQRLFTVLGTVPDLVTTWRNHRGPLPSFDSNTNEAILPAGILLDGHESGVGRVSTWDHGIRPGPQPPTLMRLEPQVFICLMPTTDMSNAGVGPLLSAYRMSTTNLITNDSVMWEYLGANGDIQYLGSITDMQSGAAMLGNMHLRYAITYVWDPLDFT
jgi:hypothetical protein